MPSTVDAPITGSVWQVLVDVGVVVSPGDVVAVLESMKLEIPVETDVSGTVSAILVAVGDGVLEGQPILSLDS